MCIEDAFECIDDERVLFFGFAEPWLWPSCVIERGIKLQFSSFCHCALWFSGNPKPRSHSFSGMCGDTREGGEKESWAGREDAIEWDLQPSSPGNTEVAVT